MKRHLILTGGIGHPFDDASRALADVLAEAGIQSEITDDIEGGIARLGEGFDLVTVYALRWRMLIGEKYAPHRAQWAFSLSEAGRSGLRDFVAQGGGLIALHTAIICFDDWPGWRDMLGATWVWGQSAHPPIGDITVRPTSRAHEITAGAGPFPLWDEVYGDLDRDRDLEPLLEADGGAGDQPMMWTRRFGEGRVVVDLLGHDRAAIEQATHRRILLNAARWVAT